MQQIRNYVCLCGRALASPVFSHESRGARFYKLPLEVCRLSGAADTPNILLPETLAAGVEDGDILKIEGEIRSYNNRTGVGARLVISVLARTIEPWRGEDDNVVLLKGAVCKVPTGRYTPLGRQICDLMLAVNRPYGRSDYIPCIAWGDSARMAAELSVGTTISLSGRLQSRDYIKCENGVTVQKTAYEVSILSFTEPQ